MPSLFRHRFRWHDDRVLVDLPGEEEEMLRHVLPQLRDLLIDDTDPALRRLRPTARPDDDEAEAAFRALVDDDLLRSRLEAIETVEAGIGGTSLDDEGVGAWMHSLNALRLVLGERLDITAIGHDALDDLPDSDDRSGLVALYEWLGWLLEQLVAAAANGIADDDPGEATDER